jgi:hypothetical protein
MVFGLFCLPILINSYLRVEYFELHYISKVSCWIKDEQLNATNNLVERFNLHIKDVLFKGLTFNKTIKVIETLGDVFKIQELQLLPEEPIAEVHLNIYIYIFLSNLF